MKMMQVCLLLFIFSQVHSYTKTCLNDNWQMTMSESSMHRDKLKGKVFNTSIPTTVHLDLEAAGEIPNCLEANNHNEVRWIS